MYVTTSPTKAVSEVLYPKQVQTNAKKDGIESESFKHLNMKLATRYLNQDFLYQTLVHF